MLNAPLPFSSARPFNSPPPWFAAPEPSGRRPRLDPLAALSVPTRRPVPSAAAGRPGPGRVDPLAAASASASASA